MVSDPISDFLTRVRNAQMAGKSEAVIPYSKLKEEIAKLLVREGYLTDATVEGKKIKKDLVVSFENEDGQAKFKGLERVSKLSRRSYMGYKDIRPVKFGHGKLIISTPEGILTDEEARTKKVGGEALFKIW